MDRRAFLRRATAAAGAAWRLPGAIAEGRQTPTSGARTQRPGPAPDGWRTFEIRTRVEVAESAGPTRVWLPVPLIVETAFQKRASNDFQAEAGVARLIERPADGLGIVMGEWPSGTRAILTMTSRVATRDFSVDVSRAPDPIGARLADVDRFLRPTALIPTDGIVKTAADRITKDARTDVDKARAIYEWIVDNTFRDPKTRGCGVGDIRFMLESGNLGGKCADLNALYVGLARAAGLPARDVYGLRVARSERGYKSLGTSSANVTKSQHCRAEVFLAGHGWVPVDPADVRKVALEEPPGNLAMTDETVRTARTRLVGSWEMNWIAYNFAHDVVLSGSSRAAIPFLMYPEAETARGALDSLDPEHFTYEITAREVI